jgi:hypothetical protein
VLSCVIYGWPTWAPSLGGPSRWSMTRATSACAMSSNRNLHADGRHRFWHPRSVSRGGS